MSILPLQSDWLPYVKDIDIKGSHWPWYDEGWEDISKYIIRTWWDNAKMKGFSVFQFDTRGFIPISKLVIHPRYRGQWEGELLLLNDIEATARKHGVPELKITIWEHDTDQIKCLTALGFKGIGLRGKFPDGTDGYEFSKLIRGNNDS